MRPILFTIAGFPVHSYGVFLVLAFFAGLYIIRRRAPKYGLDPAKLSDVMIVTLIAGVFGARILFILQELPYYQAHPRELWSPEFSGLTSFGSILFGLIVVAIWSARTRIPLLRILDCTLVPFLVAHAVGRVGCFLNGCCYGGVCSTDLPWKIHVAGNPLWHHPAQLYDSAMNIAAYFFIIRIERNRLSMGQSAGLATCLHGLTRFIYEFWRGGTQAQVNSGEASSTYWIGWMTQAQAVAGGLVILGIWMYIHYGKRTPASQELLVDLPTTKEAAAV